VRDVPVREGTRAAASQVAAGLKALCAPVAVRRSDVTDWVLKIRCESADSGCCIDLRCKVLASSEPLLPLSSPMRKSGRAAQAPLPLRDSDIAVSGILAALELRQPGACKHAERVADLALNLTRAIDAGLAAQDGIGHAYLLHDIGKLGVPDAIVLKPARLTRSELAVMRTHTRLGAEMVRRLRFLSPVVHEVVAHHHERWDGRGYPTGLGSWAIPLAARVLSVVDAFDAMTQTRPYRDALPVAWAIAELKRCAGTQFDPGVVEAFLQLHESRSNDVTAALEHATYR
jgi:putative nucleotidyltransferase with HDIG domain